MTRTLRPTVLLLVVVAPILCSSTASAEGMSPAFRSLMAANVAAHVADLSTTLHALRQPGLREGNPALSWASGSPLALGTAKFGMVALSTWGKLELYKRNPKAWVSVIAEAALVTWLVRRNHGLAAGQRGLPR